MEALNNTLSWVSRVFSQFRSVENGNRFWARLLDLCSTAPEILGLICEHLSKEDQKALRGVNRAMRVAMNSTVTRISLRPATLPATHQELHKTFPNLSKLTVGTFNPKLTSVEDGCRLCLHHLAAPSNAGLLSKVQLLSLTIPVAMTTVAEAGAVWELLNRCTRLLRLKISIAFNEGPTSRVLICLTGKGTDTWSQTCSLQQQLAAFRHSPVFLAPATWPLHLCLTHFHHPFNPPTGMPASANDNPFAAHLHHALCTPSIQHLAFPRGHAIPPSAAPLLTALTNLTHLQFTPTHTDPTNPLLHCPPALSLLQALSITFDVNPENPRGETSIVTLPPSWSQLTRLKALHITGQTATEYLLHLPLCQLSALSGLQDLTLSLLPLGSLGDLAPLTGLTRLRMPSPLLGQLGQAAPAAPLPAAGPAPAAAALAAAAPAAAAPAAGPAPAAPAAAAPAPEPHTSSPASATSTAPPAAWGSRLQHLETCGPWPPLVTRLPQLTALKHLCWPSIAVTPEFCRALPSLPALTRLDVLNPIAPPAHYRAPHPLPEASRPLLTSLQTVSFIQQYNTPSASLPLHLLATTTRLPPSCQLLIAQGWAGPLQQVVEVCSWSRSWLEAALRVSRYDVCNLVVQDDADVDTLVGALGVVTGLLPPLGICFGQGVTVEGMGRLAAKLPVPALVVGDDSHVGAVVGGWAGRLPLMSQHLVALLPVVPHLMGLQLYGCDGSIGDEDLDAVCEAGGKLMYMIVWRDGSAPVGFHRVDGKLVLDNDLVLL